MSVIVCGYIFDFSRTICSIFSYNFQQELEAQVLVQRRLKPVYQQTAAFDGEEASQCLIETIFSLIKERFVSKQESREIKKVLLVNPP